MKLETVDFFVASSVQASVSAVKKSNGSGSGNSSVNDMSSSSSSSSEPSSSEFILLVASLSVSLSSVLSRMSISFGGSRKCGTASGSIGRSSGTVHIGSAELGVSGILSWELNVGELVTISSFSKSCR